jgi:hypothetical protein
MKETRKFWSENSREIDYLKHLEVGRRILSKTVFGKQHVKFLEDSAG